MTRIDPSQSFASDVPNVGYPIANRPFDRCGQRDGR
jgi:hypothetical protein